MKICGIVAEYNPFHNGHRYHIEKTRHDGATHIVSVMSGNFVQRGEFAVMDKSARVKTALLNGVDLVVELPLICAVSTAQNFAYGAVSVLNSLGCVEKLSFGSECGDISKLVKASEASADMAVMDLTKENLKYGVTYAKAREKAVEEIYGEEISNVLSCPNDTLAVEYIAALKRIDSEMVPYAVKRFGAFHDSQNVEGSFISASAIRKKIRSENTDIEQFVPESVNNIINAEIEKGRAPVFSESLNTTMMYTLRRMSREDFLDLPDVSEGLENRIVSAVSESCSVDEILKRIKTKRYTLARIRRILLYALLGLDRKIVSEEVPYIRVLGLNERGKDVLRIARKTASLPIVMKSADAFKIGDRAGRIFEAECRATDIYSLAMPVVLPCGAEMTRQIIVV